MDKGPQSGSRRVAVIGGGFSGLSAAIRLMDLAGSASVPLQLTLIEASSQTGGIVGTTRIGRYLVERGGDSFITNKPGGIELCRRLGLASRLIATDPAFRRALVLHQGKPVPVPAGFQLVAPTRTSPFLNSRLLSWRGKKRVMSERWIPARRDGVEESVAGFVRRRFGDEAYDRLIQPLVGGIYTGDLERLSIDATFPRFVEMERRCGSVLGGMRRSGNSESGGARYGLFATLQGGMSELLDAARNEIARCHTIQTGANVENLSRNSQGTWNLQIAGQLQPFDAVIVAVPAYRAAPLLRLTAPELANLLAGIEFSSSAIVVTGHRLDDVADPLDGAGLVIPHVERRQILAVSYSSRKFPDRAPPGHVVLRTFLGGSLREDQVQHSDEELTRIVRTELQQLLGVRWAPDFCEIVRYPQGIPQFVIGHRARVAAIESAVTRTNRLAIAGNAYHGVGIPDAIQSGFDAAIKIWNDFSGPTELRESPLAGVGSIASSPGSSHDLGDSGHHLAAGLTQ